MVNHEALIEDLSQSLAPVRRPFTAPVRALAWMALAMPCAFLATRLITNYPPQWSAPGMGWAMAEIALSLVLGVAAMVLAFEGSIAGRGPVSRRGVAVLGVLAVVWLAVCLGNIMVSPPPPLYRFGAGMHCYTFMMLGGAPMMPLTILALRRTRALHPRRTLVVAGTGIAFLVAGLLGFCHPGTLHLVDFLMHLAAGLSIVVLTALCGQRFIAV